MTPYEELRAELSRLTDGRNGVVDLGCGPERKFWDCLPAPTLGVDAVDVPGVFRGDFTRVADWLLMAVSVLGYPPDTITMLDSLEHVNHEEGSVLLKRLKYYFSRIILFVPLGNHPQDHGPDDPNTHRATWTAEELEALGFNVKVWPEFHDLPSKDHGACLAVWDRP